MKYLFLIFCLSISFHLASKTIIVCSSCDVKTIENGISLTENGDTVIVKKGTYKEAGILIDKEITLIGEENSIIDGNNIAESVITVTANNVSISGLKIINVGFSYIKEFAAIFVIKSKYFTFSNIHIENVFYGFIIQKSKYGLIQDNTVISNAVEESSSGNGIHMWHCEHMRIEKNEVSGVRDGIYLEFVNKSFISYNASHNNVRYGLHFMFSHENEYHHNNFKENGAGVAVMFSKKIKMHHNHFQFNWGTASYGLLLKEINDAEITDNIFEQNTIGINIDGCNRITYSKNTFLRNGWAVKFKGGCYTNVFEFNNFLYNAFDLSYNSRLNDNTFDANYWSDYAGYDLDRDGIGDVPYRPVKLFSYVVNKTPETLVLLRSLFVDIINFSEKVSPVFTPDNLMDNTPLMKEIHD